MRIIILVIFLVFVGCSSKSKQYSPEKKVALVIANQSYRDKPLKNPINDAKGVIEVLKRLNFKPKNILFKTDINYKKFKNVLQEFKKKIDKNTVAFIYFSGHANTLMANSTNSFLMMVDDKEEVLVSIHKIYEVLALADARHNIICIDACRDYRPNNQKGGIVYRNGDIDISDIEELGYRIEDSNHSKPPRSTVVSFAADINEGARDKGLIDKNHSPYARYLIKHLDDVDIPVSEIFNRIRVDMRKELNGAQRNLEQGALEGNPWLNPKKADRPSTTSF